MSDETKPDNQPEQPPEKKPHARWQKGQSGNPKGRAKGVPNRLTLVRQELETPELVQFALRATVQAAKAGDVGAIRLLLERIWPAPKSTYQTAQIDVARARTLSQRGEAVVAAMLAGDLSADVGQTMLAALAQQTRVVESEELTERVARLEALLSGDNPGAA